MCLLRRVARLVLLLGVVVPVFALIHPAQGVIRDGGIDPANLGKGDWIYILPNAINQWAATCRA